MSELTDIFVEGGPCWIWQALMIRLNGNIEHDARLIFEFARALNMDPDVVVRELRSSLHSLHHPPTTAIH